MAYVLFPFHLTEAMVDHMLALGALLPRYLVLILSRYVVYVVVVWTFVIIFLISFPHTTPSSEREARERAKQQMAKHLIYRQKLVDHIEYTSKTLEKQRLEVEYANDMMANHISLSGLDSADSSHEQEPQGRIESCPPTAVDILNDMISPSTAPEFVPAPDPLPVTPTLYLPDGNVRDFIIGMGKGYVPLSSVFVFVIFSPLYSCIPSFSSIFGHAFPPSSAADADWKPKENLVTELHWVLTHTTSLHTMNNPFLSFPPDDAAYLNYLLLLTESAHLHANPSDTWIKVCHGIRSLIFRYGLTPAMVLGPLSRSISPWVSPSAVGVGHSKRGTGTAYSCAGTDHMCIPGELFLYDDELATFICRNIGMPDDVINDEFNYWVSFFTVISMFLVSFRVCFFDIQLYP
jgi:hypothetical protein